MSGTKLTQEDVQEILRLVEAAEHFSEFHLRFGDVEIGFSRDGGGGVSATVGAASVPAQGPRPAAAPQPPAAKRSAVTHDALPPGAVLVKAPMVGTFYRAPAPGAPPFVEVGGHVDPDTIVCIIEVMKLMNSIHAGVRGTVRQIRLEDGNPVEFGQVLIVIEPGR